MRGLLRHSIAMLRNVRLILLHVIGNAVLLVAASLWLLIPEEHVWQLLVAGISGLLIVFGLLWIHSGTLAYGAEPVPEGLGAALRPVIGRLLWLLIGVYVLFWCMGVVDGWSDSAWQTSGYLYSKTPAFLRPTRGEVVYYDLLGYVFPILYWYALPGLFLPLIAARVVRRDALQGLRTLLRPQYWLATAITALLGVWLTRLILAWTPGHSLRAQTVSLGIRLALAYGIATAAWLLTAGILGYFTGSGDPVDGVSWRGLWKRVVPPGGQTHAMIQHCRAVVSNKRLLLLQGAGCTVLAVVSGAELYFQWDTAIEIATGTVGAIVLLVAFLWLHSSTLVYAAGPAPQRFGSAFSFRFRRIGWLFLALATLLVLMIGTEAVLRSSARGVYPWWLDQTRNAISWYLVPSLVLPYAMAKVGVNGRFRNGHEALRSWRYWVGMAAIVFFAQFVADQLPVWRLATMGLPTGVMVAVRSAVIGLPYIAGWVLSAGLVGYFATAHTAANLVGQPSP